MEHRIEFATCMRCNPPCIKEGYCHNCQRESTIDELKDQTHYVKDTSNTVVAVQPLRFQKKRTVWQ